MKTRLYVVRHGESEDNAAGRFGGRRDAALTGRGREEAAALAEWFRRVAVDVVGSSPLRRARETAERIAAGARLPAHVWPGWEEASFGRWEGLTFAEARAREPQAVDAWLQAPLSSRSHGGESFLDVCARVARAAEELVRAHRGRRVVLVTHGGPIRALVAHALGAPPEAALRLDAAAAGVTVIDWHDGAPVLVGFNCNCAGHGEE